MASDFKDCFIEFHKVVNIGTKRSENTPTLIESDNLQSLSMPYIKGKTLGAFLRIASICGVFLGKSAIDIKEDTDTTNERDSLAIKRVISFVL